MFDTSSILEAGGLLLLCLIIFAESGLLLGLLLPGDTLLIAGGIFAAGGKLPLVPLIILVLISTIAGYQLGYLIGRTAGPRIFKRKDGVLFRKDYIEKTEKFFARHGWKTVIIARFIGVVRTIVPLVAGVGNMSQKAFFVYNVIGGVLWSAGLILLSYWLGSKVPQLEHYIQYMVVAGIAFTWLVIMFEVIKNPSKRKGLVSALKEEIKFIFTQE